LAGFESAILGTSGQHASVVDNSTDGHRASQAAGSENGQVKINDTFALADQQKSHMILAQGCIS
jgi:hypothetical protein